MRLTNEVFSRRKFFSFDLFARLKNSIAKYFYETGYSRSNPLERRRLVQAHQRGIFIKPGIVHRLPLPILRCKVADDVDCSSPAATSCSLARFWHARDATRTRN